jgi:hypothetical protein
MGKLFGSLVITGALIGGVFFVIENVRADYEWQSAYGALWDLGVKAATIDKKSEYIDKFVAALDKSGLAGTNNSLFFPTENKGFDANMDALKSLQGRLHAIQKMDESSFQYQSAIQQITSQEQDEATDMLDVLSGSWMKVHHYYLWNPWWGLGIIVGLFLVFFMGCIIIIE